MYDPQGEAITSVCTVAHRNPVVAATPDCYLGICGRRRHDQCCPQVKTLKNRLKFFTPFLADFYGYNALAKHQQQGLVGPITREEHDLQLWYSGGLPGEPRGIQEPRNLLGSESYEEYKKRYLLPDFILTDDYVWEKQG